MRFIIDFIKGIFMGVANIIPGVSGGTMAVSMGIYDRVIEAINNLTKQFKKSVLVLLPVILGMIAGIGVFSFIIPHSLKNYTFATAMCFTGLVLGGLPELLQNTGEAFKKKKKGRVTPFHILIFLVFIGIALFMAFSNGNASGSGSIDLSFMMVVTLLGLGIVSAATMVVPGISGSLLLMMLGYYSGIIGTISSFIAGLKGLKWAQIWHCIGVLVPFAIGCILGVLLIAKIINWLFKRFEASTYCAILGLVVTSPFAIIYKTRQEYGLDMSGKMVGIGIVVFLISMFFTYIFGRLTNHTK